MACTRRNCSKLKKRKFPALFAIALHTRVSRPHEHAERTKLRLVSIATGGGVILWTPELQESLAKFDRDHLMENKLLFH